MNSGKYKTVILILSCIILSCAADTSKQQDAYNAVYDKVMKVHDSLMVRMGDVAKYTQAMQQEADSSSNPELYKATQQRLEDYNKRMMEWMKDFGEEFVKQKTTIKNMNASELQKSIKALELELKEVNEMKAEMNSSLEEAKKLTER